MIHPTSVMTLAYTKLKSRRLRLTITLLIISLMFSLLIAASLILAGFYNSFDKFSSEGLSGRYVVYGVGNPIIWNETQGISRIPALITHAESLQQQLELKKEITAKELGIKYETSSNNSAVFTNPDGSKQLNIMSDIGKQVIAEYRSTLKISNQLSFSKQFNDIVPTNTYKSIDVTPLRNNSPTLTLIEAGKEPTKNQVENNEQVNQGLYSITRQGSWKLFDSALLLPFLLANQTLSIGADGSIPVIAPYSAAENMLGISPLVANSNPEQKRERLELLRNKSGGTTFQVCYRNSISKAQFDKAVGQQADKIANQDKKDYVEPKLLLDIPTAPCGTPIVEKDNRTISEKIQDEKQLVFDQTFGQSVAKSELITFRVVGLSRDHAQYAPNQNNFTPEQFIDSAFALSVGGGWFTPLTVGLANESIKDVFLQEPGALFGDGISYYAEFATATQAKQALLSKTCTVKRDNTRETTFGNNLPTSDSVPDCSRDGRQFYLQPFGGNSILIDQFKVSVQKVMVLAGGCIAFIAAIVLMGMLGRVIADAKKETAIFRALGATRLSIIQIYLTYTSFLVMLIITLSVSLGLILAYIFDIYYSPNFSIAAVVAFSVKDLNQKFSFLAIDWLSIGLIVIIILIAASLAAIIPISRSTGRNPMNDMREE